MTNITRIDPTNRQLLVLNDLPLGAELEFDHTAIVVPEVPQPLRARVLRSLGANTLAVSYEVELLSAPAGPPQPSPRRLLKVARVIADPAAYTDAQTALEREGIVMRRLNSTEAGRDGRRHIPLVEAFGPVHIGLTGAEEVSTLALLTELPLGKNVEDQIRDGRGLGELVGLQIACQLAEVVGFAHHNNVQFADLRPIRLIWDRSGWTPHLTVIDWSAAKELDANTETPDSQLASRYEDLRGLARLIFWLIVGQPPRDRIDDSAIDQLSDPLRMLLSRALNQPTSFGEYPTEALGERMALLLDYWQQTALYDQVEARVNELARGGRFDPPDLEALYDQVGVGTARDREWERDRQKWRNLRQLLDRLWGPALQRIRSEVASGNFAAAAEQIDAIRSYPPFAYRSLLWRRRIARIGIADQAQLAPRGRDLANLIDSLDRNDYIAYKWLLDLKNQVNPSAAAALDQFLAELWLAMQIDAFGQVPESDPERRLDLVGQLEKYQLPEGIDERLQAERLQAVTQRPLLEAQRRTKLQSAEFVRILTSLRQRVLQIDPTLTSEDFDQLLAGSTSINERREVYDLSAIWQANRSIDQALSDGDLATASAVYRGTAHVWLPDVQSSIGERIATTALKQAGLPVEADISPDVAFTRITELPATSPAELSARVSLLRALLPLAAPHRQQMFTDLAERERRVRQAEQVVRSLDVSFDDKQQAFNQLLQDGIRSLDDQLLVDAFDPVGVQRQRLTMRDEIEAVLRSMLAQLPERESLPPPMTSMSDRLAVLDGDLQSAQPQWAIDQHSQLWRTATAFGLPLLSLVRQHDYVTARSLLLTFDERFRAQGSSATDLNDDQRIQALHLAREIGRTGVLLTGTPYEPSMTREINTRRDWLERSISERLGFDDGLPPAEQALRLVEARSLLQIADALSGPQAEPGTLPLESIAPLLREPDLDLRRKLLAQLPATAGPEAVRQAFDAAPPIQEGGGIPLIVMLLGLLLALTVGLLAGPFVWARLQPPVPAAVAPTAVATAVPTTPPPTATPAADWSLGVSGAPIIELSAGETKPVSLTLDDSNDTMTQATLLWEAPPGITVAGVPTVTLALTETVIPLRLTAAEDVQPSQQPLRVTLVEDPAASVTIGLVIAGPPEVVAQARTLEERLLPQRIVSLNGPGVLRVAPTLDAPEVSVLESGEQLVVERTPPDGDWLFVSRNSDRSQRGWVFATDKISYTTVLEQLPFFPPALSARNASEPLELFEAPAAQDTARPVTPGDIRLLSLLPTLRTGEVWINVRITPDPADPAQFAEGWVRADQTTYADAVRELQAQLGSP